MVWNSFPLRASTFVYICGPSGSACSANLVVVGTDYLFLNYNLTGHRPVALLPLVPLQGQLLLGGSSSTRVTCSAGSPCTVSWSLSYPTADVYVCPAFLVAYAPQCSLVYSAFSSSATLYLSSGLYLDMCPGVDGRRAGIGPFLQYNSSTRHIPSHLSRSPCQANLVVVSRVPGAETSGYAALALYPFGMAPAPVLRAAASLCVKYPMLGGGCRQLQI
eukprot:tig00020531_g10011.t1